MITPLTVNGVLTVTQCLLRRRQPANMVILSRLSWQLIHTNYQLRLEYWCFSIAHIMKFPEFFIEPSKS